MNLDQRVVVVTGAASGIGRALAMRFAADGARVALVDLDPAVASLADEIGAAARFVIGDVAEIATHQRAVEVAEATFGPVDLYCSNAGVAGPTGLDAQPSAWDLAWRVNVLSHVLAAQVVLPGMLQRGTGHLLNTASAAGLLLQLGSAPYTVTKHAAVGFAEWLTVTYGDRGIGVSVLCPEGVETPMLLRVPEEDVPARALLLESAVLPSDVAEAAVRGLESGAFLIYTHESTATHVERKARDRDRWLDGMRRLQAHLDEAAAGPSS